MPESVTIKWNLLIITAIIAIVCACGEGNASAKNVIERDTTITPELRVTNLTLDSLTLDKFLLSKIDEEDLRNKILGFYNARNYQFAWFNEDGLTQHTEAFWSMHAEDFPRDSADGYQHDNQLHLKLDSLLNEEMHASEVDSLAIVEMELTLHFFNHIRIAFDNDISPEEMQWHIPQRKLREAEILDSFLSRNEKDVRIFGMHYYRMENKLDQYLALKKNGGWHVIPWAKQKFRKGDTDTMITQVKKRLSISGDWSSSDTSQLFTDSLQATIQKIQTSFGLTASGLIDADLIEKLNVPLESRIRQMIINMTRMKWMPRLPPNYLLANIPEFKLHVIDSSKEVMQIKIVVGKAANKTVIFSDELKYVVFSPYWNVPRSIVRNEIVPAMNRSKNYLSRNNMEITGYSNGLPIVRQRPGRGNALGKVKFIFPNRYNIYFHDTPSKSLFERAQRTFSHGCIRLEKPFELAEYLLRNEKGWTEKSIRQAMNSKSEKWVTLPSPVPVFIVYFTSWVSDDGTVNFRDDVYGHDSRIEKRLFN